MHLGRVLEGGIGGTSAVFGTDSQNISILMGPRVVCRVTDMLSAGVREGERLKWFATRRTVGGCFHEVVAMSLQIPLSLDPSLGT